MSRSQPQCMTHWTRSSQKLWLPSFFCFNQLKIIKENPWFQTPLWSFLACAGMANPQHLINIIIIPQKKKKKHYPILLVNAKCHAVKGRWHGRECFEEDVPYCSWFLSPIIANNWYPCCVLKFCLFRKQGLPNACGSVF